MKIKEVIQLENGNTRCCYLIPDGIFWRAYEKSAFWFVKNLKPYLITKKHFKGINADVAFLGFPDTVLHEILALVEANGYLVNKQEKMVTIGGIEIMEGFENWKNEIPYQTPDQPKPLLVREPAGKYETVQGFEAPQSLLRSSEGIAALALARIKSFPIAERTPLECQQFIVELQNIIHGTI